MIAKLFEVRDRMTFIPILAVKLTSKQMAENYLLNRAGFRLAHKHKPFILVTRLTGNMTAYAPYQWGDNTMTTIHEHLVKNFSKCKSGDVLDCEFIRGEKDTIKESERERD